MAQAGRKELLEQLSQANALIKKQAGEIATLNTYVEGLQEAVRNQGVSPEEMTAVQDLLSALEDNGQKLAMIFTENTPPRTQP